MYTKQEIKTYEARIYIGSREGYNGIIINRARLDFVLKLFQKKSIDNVSCLRLTRTSYLANGSNGLYKERGWEISAINYPRSPKTETHIEAMMRRLSSHLLIELKQNRVSLILPDVTTLYTSDTAQENHNAK